VQFLNINEWKIPGSISASEASETIRMPPGESASRMKKQNQTIHYPGWHRKMVFNYPRMAMIFGTCYGGLPR
jgi:hypothetical protein